MINKEIRISVRNLIEFLYRSGDINNKFTNIATRAQEGTKIHQYIQNNLKEQYKDIENAKFISEQSLKFDLEYRNINFCIEGRADGILHHNDNVTIIEIKSTSKDVKLLEENSNLLHWSQAMSYAYIYGIQNSLDKLTVELLYCQLESYEVRTFTRQFSINELENFFYEILERYYHWANFTSNWLITRNESINKLEFPFSKYRPGQREFAVSVYRTIKEGKKLYAQAPTGIGKTISTSFPALKALGEGMSDRIFYLTAKTITRTVAEDTISILYNSGVRLKSTTITAKEKICFKEKCECNPDYCEYAKGHFDRVNTVIFDMLNEKDNFSRDIIEEYSRKFMVCPFELSLDLTLWSDFIICDYNYLFDPRVYLKRFFVESNESYIFLIDEAHNLIERSREMFSAEFSKEPILKLKNYTKKIEPKIYKALNKLNNYMIELRKDISEKSQMIIDEPKEVYKFVKEFIEACEEYLARNEFIENHDDIIELYFSMLTFIKISEYYSKEFITYIERTGQDIKLKLFCINSSKMIKDSLKKGKSTIFFSATLSPSLYFKELLGGETEDYYVKLPSPFKKENRKILIGDKINTKFNYRQYSYDTICTYIYESINEYRGNYIIFFPSYSYMKTVYDIFSQRYSIENVIMQDTNMNEEERELFLKKFDMINSQVTAFCVLGGIFSEGIDLKGDKLKGVIIIGVGLPQLCFERKIIEEYFEKNSKSGFHYAYTFPGMNKVIQAAGRVIRSENDEGIIILLDNRFTSELYQKILPEEWTPFEKISNTDELRVTLKNFKEKSMK